MHVVLTAGKQELVDLGGTDVPHVINRVGLIGSVEELRGFVCTAVQRLIFEEGEVHASEPQLLVAGQIEIDCDRVFALVLRVLRRKKPVVVAVNRRCKVRDRIGIKNSEPIRARC